MKTFDYIRAWDDLAYPAWLTLPASIKGLVALTGEQAGDLHQIQDLTMPWPEGPGFKSAFEAHDSDTLALASRVVYYLGHWQHPRAGFTPACSLSPAWNKSGAHWKFSHYADQVLRERLGLQGREKTGERGFGFALLEGAIRLTYSSNDMWTWEEVAPGTEAGLEKARAIKVRGQQRVSSVVSHVGHTRLKDNAAYDFMQQLKAERAEQSGYDWPPAWRPLMNTADYMIEEEEFRAREARHPDVLEKTIDGLKRRYNEEVVKATVEYEGKLWLAERGQDLGNWIYYPHRNTFTCGWHIKLTPERGRQAFEEVAGFPFACEILTTDGTIFSNRDVTTQTKEPTNG